MSRLVTSAGIGSGSKFTRILFHLVVLCDSSEVSGGGGGAYGTYCGGAYGTFVAVCVRVCWYCHQSGGTDVVDLPDILLPAGQYLDMFDSESETDVPSDSSDEELVEV